MSRTSLSLEPPRVLAFDGLDDNPFAAEARLVDVDENGKQLYTRSRADKSVSERLLRIWQERGDFSQVTAASIERAARTQERQKAGGNGGDDDDELHAMTRDDRPTAAEMKEMQNTLMEQLALARGELATALDLLSVVAPLTDPPTVDLEALPLPPQTLAVTPTVPPRLHDNKNASADADMQVNQAALPLATSLASIKASAASFFATADELLSKSTEPSSDSATKRTRAAPGSSHPSPWPLLLHLRASSSYSLLPLGALPNATLSGKGETRAARQVGIFYGCDEAREMYRRASIVRAADLVSSVEEGRQVGRGGTQGKGKGKSGRTLVVDVELDGRSDRAMWLDREDVQNTRSHVGALESMLGSRRRAAFAEELFATLSNEARNDASLKATFKLGTKAEGDSVLMEGHGWNLRISMISNPTRTPSHHSSLAPTKAGLSSIVLPLLRLLFLKDYARRRYANSESSYSKSLLHVISTFLSHASRLHMLFTTLQEQESVIRAAGMSPEVEFWGAQGSRHHTVEQSSGEAVTRILDGERELGGRAVLRASKSLVFHISFSLLMPHLVTPTSIAATAGHESLILHAPRSLPVPISSTAHLKLFLSEQVTSIVNHHQAATTNTR